MLFLSDIKKIPFSPPDISEEEISEVADALRSGWITTGPKVKQFEKNIAEYLGVSKVCCLSSQTSCAEMALRLLGIGEDDEVITCAYTYTATASVVCHVGAKLVLVDVEKDTYHIDYDALEKAITEKTKAIIPIDLGGIPCDYDRLFQIVEKKKILFHPSNKIQESIGRIAICSDTAHAFGAEVKGKRYYSGDFSAYSFHAVKNLTTAEGGVLVWRPIDGISDEQIYAQLQLYSLHGQNKDALSKTKIGGAWEYDIIGTWYKCNMTDIAAAIGLKQLERYPMMLKKRREIIEKYDAAFKPFGIEIPEHYSSEYTSSGHLYLTRIPNITIERRNEIIGKMVEFGIATNVHYKPLPMHTAYKQLGFDINDFPNAYLQFANEITLPLYTRLTDDDVEYIIKKFIDVMEKKP